MNTAGYFTVDLPTCFESELILGRCTVYTRGRIPCWSLILKGEHRSRVLENTVLGRIFQPGRREVRGGCRKLRNEEIHNLCSSPKVNMVIKYKIRKAVTVARMG